MRISDHVTGARRVASALALLCLPLVFAAGPAQALGDDSAPVPTCTKGNVWDSKTKKCVKQTSAIPDADLTNYAYALAKAERYDEALSVLDSLTDPKTPQALNYRGYSLRKLGRTDEGIGYYLQSVSMDPRYAKVREYLGEAYVIKGQIDLAKDQLTHIRSICGTDCEEYRDLAEAIQSPSSL